jgi:sugar lactone lactonase YvrE
VIDSVEPRAAIPGGELTLRGAGFTRAPRPSVTVGGVPAHLVVSSANYVVVRMPDASGRAALVLDNGGAESEPQPVAGGALLAENVHPVASPVADAHGNVFTTFSGSRGQKTPVSVFLIDRDGTMSPLASELMNATGLAFNRAGLLHVSSRFDGIIYQVSPGGEVSVFVEGMGVATGIAFDRDDNLYVGDRSGTVFKISPDRQIFVFATIEPSISAYHLAFGPDGSLFLTGPTTSSNDVVSRISPQGEVSVLYRGLGRPQGMSLDADGNLYVAASWEGRKGVVRLTPGAEPSMFLTGPSIVGTCIAPSGDMVVATGGALYRVPVGLEPFAVN